MTINFYLDYFFAFCFAFGATFGCSIVFNTTKKDALLGSFIGGMGWLVYKIACNYINPAESYFLGSFTVAILSEFLAMILKKPATVYLLPGLLPLVPGGGMFQTMEAAVLGNMSQTLEIGFTTLSAAGSIAFGIAFASSLAKIFHSIRRQKILNKV